MEVLRWFALLSTCSGCILASYLMINRIGSSTPVTGTGLRSVCQKNERAQTLSHIWIHTFSNKTKKQLIVAAVRFPVKITSSALFFVSYQPALGVFSERVKAG